MGKLFGVLAILGAAISGLAIFLVSGAVLVLLPALAIVSSIVLLIDRRALAVILALVLLVAGVMAFPATAGDFTVGSSGTSLNLLGSAGLPFAIALGLLVALAFLAVEWPNVRPVWIAPVGAAFLAIAYVWTFLVDHQVLGSISRPGATLLPGLIALAGVVPGVFLLQVPPPAPRARPPPAK